MASHPYEATFGHMITRLDDDKIRRVLRAVSEASAPPYCGMGVAPTQTPDEIAFLCLAMLTVEPAVVVEIGSQFGGSLWFWIALTQRLSQNVAPKTQIFSVDLPGHIHGCAPANERETLELWRSWIDPSQQELHILRANSQLQTTATAVKDILHGRAIDFLFIDGDHRYSGVKRDYELYSPLVRPGGIIAFHDTDPVINRAYRIGVNAFVNTLKPTMPSYGELFNHFGVTYFVKPEIGQPARPAYDAGGLLARLKSVFRRS